MLIRSGAEVLVEFLVEYAARLTIFPKRLLLQCTRSFHGPLISGPPGAARSGLSSREALPLHKAPQADALRRWCGTLGRCEILCQAHQQVAHRGPLEVDHTARELLESRV